MVVIDRNRCIGCGKCAAMRILLPQLKDKDNIEYYQDPIDKDIAFVENIMRECWANCIFIYKDGKVSGTF
ncbi:MAG: 4Fe-4S binding protein [Eubacterium sp.]|nr:4Fe-4S binding protein [Candidatus Colimonas fimequi]